MKRTHLPPTIAAAYLSLLIVAGCTMPASQKARTQQNRWITAWMSAPSWEPKKDREGETVTFSNQSVRQDVRVGAAADRVRLRLSNELGDDVITVAGVRVARINAGGKLDAPLSVHFDGRPSVTLQPHEARTSDDVAVTLPPFSDLAISVYYPGTAEPVAHRLTVRVADGEQMPATQSKRIRGPAIVSAVEVALGPASAKPAVIVAFGDSITEGAGSHVAHGDWPSRLAQRLEQACPGGFVVLNAGISGNQLLADGGSPNGESRLDRDVLSVAGVSHVIVMEGINDIRRTADGLQDAGTAAALEAGYRQVVGRLHARHIKVIGATLTPYAGTARQTPLGLQTVARLNDSIRNGQLFDAVIDFYAAIDDPANPGRMRPEMSSGDWLHPSDAGYAAMTAAIPTDLFGPCPATHSRPVARR